MPDIFADQETDLSVLYQNGPQDPDPAESLFSTLKGAATGPSGAGVGGASVPTRAPSGGTSVADGRMSGLPEGQQRLGGGGSSVGNPNMDTTGVLARLQPLGITSIAAIRGKSDAELRKLSSDVVTYELREQSLARFFKKNADGSWDFTVGPDGTPTGLDANGKVLAPGAGAAPGNPAPKPAGSPAPKPTPAPAAKPAPPKPGVATIAPRPASQTTAPTRPTSTRPTSTSGTTRVRRPPAPTSPTTTVNRTRLTAL